MGCNNAIFIAEHKGFGLKYFGYAILSVSQTFSTIAKIKLSLTISNLQYAKYDKRARFSLVYFLLKKMLQKLGNEK